LKIPEISGVLTVKIVSFAGIFAGIAGFAGFQNLPGFKNLLLKTCTNGIPVEDH